MVRNLVRQLDFRGRRRADVRRGNSGRFQVPIEIGITGRGGVGEADDQSVEKLHCGRCFCNLVQVDENNYMRGELRTVLVVVICFTSFPTRISSAIPTHMLSLIAAFAS